MVNGLEHQLASAQAVAHIGSWEWDARSDQLTWSDEHYRIFGVPLGIPVTMSTIMQCIHPDDRNQIQRHFEQSLQDGKPYRCEFRVIHADGTVRFVEARAVVELDETGHAARNFGTAQDVTERVTAAISRHGSDEMRRYLLARVMAAQEEERTRIARELHDDMGQALSAVLLGLRTMEQASTLEEVHLLAHRLRDLTAQTVRDVGRLARGLRPSTLDDLGLFPALQRYAEELSASHGLTAHISGDCDARFPANVETTLYRIVQEALTNVARHAHAQSVDVTIQRMNESVQVIVRDDGEGFDVHSALEANGSRRALGLVGMHERASLLGGSLVISSRPGEGTSITTELPLERAE